MLSTVGDAGEVLDLFTTECPDWGVTAVARQLDIPKSRAHDLLASLTAIGLLDHVPHGSYRLGWRSLGLARTQMRTSPLRLHAEPVMREVAADYAAGLLLFVWDRGSLLCVGRQDPSPPLHRRRPSVGARFRADESAAGRILLAYRSAAGTAAAGGADAPAGEPCRGARLVERDLRRVRRRGFATGRDAGASGTPELAAPIRDARDHAVAALSIAAPALRSDANAVRYDDLVVSAAARISRALCGVQSASEEDRPTTDLRASSSG
jgi:DNA-binding IclR family transcriptional regulator